MQSTFSVSTFLRDLLTRCIGGVMIEPEQWNFPNDGFDRGFFNTRLKQDKPINARTHKRFIFVFSHLFAPEKRTDSKFGEAAAVNAANELILLFQEYFFIDLHIWDNTHTSNNHESRSHLLQCLDIVLSAMENESAVSAEGISTLLSNYLEKVNRLNLPQAPEYPSFLGRMPYGMTEHFIGRASIINSTVQQLTHSVPVFLHGIGGIGKTEIAKATLNRIINTPISEHGIRHILWVRYVENDFARSLVESLHMDTSAHNIDSLFHEAIEAINQYRDRLLMVIDNVESDSDDRLLQVTQYLKCRFLITSRVEGFHQFTRIPIPAMGMDDCMSLFYCYYHSIHDDISLRKIIELADYHTVTVELLAKIADTEEVLLHEFLHNLIRCGFRISDEEASTSHEQLRSDGRIIDQLQKLFKIYGCTDSEELLLTQISSIPSIPFHFEQGKRWFSLKNRTDLNHLAKRGWIKKETIYTAGRAKHLYSIHSVIASAIRAQRQTVLYDSCQSFIREITVDMQNASEKNDAEKKTLIQFSWSLNDIFSGDFHSESDCDFLWALAEIYRDIGYYEKALPLLEKLKVMYKSLYGEGCIELSSVWNSCGLIHFELSHFEDALAEYNTSRSILLEHIEPEDLSELARTELGKLDMNIGNVYRKLDFSKSASYFDSAYQTFLDILGDDAHPTMLALGYKAIYAAQAGQLSDAEKTYLDIYDRSRKYPDDRDMLLLHAEVAHHLGSLYGDYAPEKAMPYLVDARDIFWNHLSPTHPDTLDVLNSICALRQQTEDDYSAILEELERLLPLFIDAYGEDDPNTGTIYNNIGLCYYYMNIPDEAIRYYREAIRIDELTYGTDHEATAYIHNNVGAVYSENGKPEKAIPEHLHALRVYQAAHPDRMNLDLAQTHCDLADAYLRLGDLDQCTEHLNEAFPIYEAMLPENAHQLLPPYSTLANLLVEANDFIQAETIYGHILWLLLQNGYQEESPSVQEFAAKSEEVKALADRQRKNSKS